MQTDRRHSPPHRAAGLVAPTDDSAALSISNLQTNQGLRCEPGSFVLTLDAEPNSTFTRGQLRSLSDRSAYPIQSNLALFDAISAFISRTEEKQGQ